MEFYIGQILLLGFNFAPRGTLPCDGRLLSIAQNSALFSLLGTMYGGDGIQTFALPNLQGRAAFGFTNAYPQGAVGNITIVENNTPPGALALNYVIVTEGVYPSRP